MVPKTDFPPPFFIRFAIITSIRVLARICNLGVQSVNLAQCLHHGYKVQPPANKDQNILNIVYSENAFLAIPVKKCPNSEIARYSTCKDRIPIFSGNVRR